MALCADAAFGQSLSIVKKGESELLIEAAAPPDTRYVLQASGNLRLWADINDEVSGEVSNRLDLAGVKQRFFRLAPWTPPPPPIRVVLLGDSTVAHEIGWGIGISGYFKPTVQVANLAQPGCSTKLFLTSIELWQMRVIKPEFVLLQYGWIDSVGCGGDLYRCGTTLQEYEGNLRTIVQYIREFNGTPILITPPDPKQFDDKGKVVRHAALHDHIAVLKKVAAELQTYLIDLNRLSADLLNELGESESTYILRSDADRVHYSPVGAQVISGLIVNALPDNLGPYLDGNFKPAKP
jgi:lysophospholipase L1-like esterase